MTEKKGHATGGSGRRQRLLYDPNIPTPTHAERARTLSAAVGHATLSTLTAQPAGHPYGSLVLFALHEGAPVFLISTLAEHTQNLQSDPRCSLLIAEGGDNPLAMGRVTLVGQAERLPDPIAARETFLSRHPSASFYADFGDFSFWQMSVASARYIGGFGRMSWVEGEQWIAASPDPIAPGAEGIISHMNEDHVDAMQLMVAAFSEAGMVDDVTMTGVDRYGFEMSAVTADGPRPIRVAFDEPVSTSMSVRKAMVALVKRARAQQTD
ncbi:MAG: DUF2470 domain-containing protein [Myxococcota bacterium]